MIEPRAPPPVSGTKLAPSGWKGTRPHHLLELRIPVPDREGVIAEVTTLASQLGVNVADFEIAHSLEGGAGVLVIVVAAEGAEALEDGLHALGYHTSRTVLP